MLHASRESLDSGPQTSAYAYTSLNWGYTRPHISTNSCSLMLTFLALSDIEGVSKKVVSQPEFPGSPACPSLLRLSLRPGYTHEVEMALADF